MPELCTLFGSQRNAAPARARSPSQQELAARNDTSSQLEFATRARTSSQHEPARAAPHGENWSRMSTVLPSQPPSLTFFTTGRRGVLARAYVLAHLTGVLKFMLCGVYSSHRSPPTAVNARL